MMAITKVSSWRVCVRVVAVRVRVGVRVRVREAVAVRLVAERVIAATGRGGRLELGAVGMLRRVELKRAMSVTTMGNE